MKKIIFAVLVKAMIFYDRLIGLRVSQSNASLELVKRMQRAMRLSAETRGRTLQQIQKLTRTMIVSLLSAIYQDFLASLFARRSRLANCPWQIDGGSFFQNSLVLRYLKMKTCDSRNEETMKVMIIREQTQNYISCWQLSEQQEVPLKGQIMKKKKGGMSSSPIKQKKERVYLQSFQSQSVGGFCSRTIRDMIRSVAMIAAKSATKKKTKQAMICGNDILLATKFDNGSYMVRSSILHPWNTPPIITSKANIMTIQRVLTNTVCHPSIGWNSLTQSVRMLRLYAPRQLLRKILELIESEQFRMYSYSPCYQNCRQA